MVQTVNNSTWKWGVKLDNETKQNRILFKIKAELNLITLSSCLAFWLNLHYAWLSDHPLINRVLNSGCSHMAPKTIEYCSYKNYDKEFLDNVPWQVTSNGTEDIDIYVNSWNKWFLDVWNTHAPTKTARVRELSVPWMTSTIVEKMISCDYYLKKAKSNKKRPAVVHTSTITKKQH